MLGDQGAAGVVHVRFYEYGASCGPEPRGVARTSRPTAFSLGISVVKEAAGKAALGLYLGFGQCRGRGGVGCRGGGKELGDMAVGGAGPGVRGTLCPSNIL